MVSPPSTSLAVSEYSATAAVGTTRHSDQQMIARDDAKAEVALDRVMYQALEQNAVAVSTHTAYARAVRSFLAYCSERDLPLITPSGMMSALTAYIGSLARMGYAPAAGRQVYAAVRTQWPALCNALGPLRGMRGWERQRPVRKRPPLTWPLTIAMAIRLVGWGMPAMAVALLLGFHAYLRIGELLRVEAWHLVPAMSLRGAYENRCGYVHIPRAKTGTMQDVTIDDADVEALTALAARAATLMAPAAGKEAHVFPISEHTFRRLFAECGASLSLPRTIVPHSMRHGGATRDYTTGRRTADEVRVRGRWKSEKSMQHYVGAMRSALATLDVPESTTRAGMAIAPVLFRAFREALKWAPANAEVAAYRAADWTSRAGGAASARAVGATRARK